jgi:cytochrome c peroxidase
MGPVLARLDPALSTPIVLNEVQFNQLLAFVRDGLLDPRATPERLQRMVPQTVASGRPMLVFEFP